MVGTKMESWCAENILAGPLIFEATQRPLLAGSHIHEMGKGGILLMLTRPNFKDVTQTEGVNDAVDLKGVSLVNAICWTTERPDSRKSSSRSPRRRSEPGIK
jgi:hypothetical protein